MEELVPSEYPQPLAGEEAKLQLTTIPKIKRKGIPTRWKRSPSEQSKPPAAEKKKKREPTLRKSKTISIKLEDGASSQLLSTFQEPIATEKLPVPRKRIKKEKPTDPFSTRKIWKTLYVKFVTSDNGAFLYIMRTDTRKPDIHFKIPYAFVLPMIDWMKYILANLEMDAEKEWHYKGEITPKLHPSDPLSIKGNRLRLLDFNMVPILPSWRNIYFKMWNETDEFRRIFQADREEHFKNHAPST